jgi:hypothetical protein
MIDEPWDTDGTWPRRSGSTGAYKELCRQQGVSRTTLILAGKPHSELVMTAAQSSLTDS